VPQAVNVVEERQPGKRDIELYRRYHRYGQLDMKRGDVISVAIQGDYGKPRPALVIQSDLFAEHPSVTILPITSELRDTPIFRITIAPNALNGLKNLSQIMVDKAVTIPREKCGNVFGNLEDTDMLKVTRALAVFFGIA
jgi:mRNA interferase MazF